MFEIWFEFESFVPILFRCDSHCSYRPHRPALCCSLCLFHYNMLSIQIYNVCKLTIQSSWFMVTVSNKLITMMSGDLHGVPVRRVDFKLAVLLVYKYQSHWKNLQHFLRPLSWIIPVLLLREGDSGGSTHL